LGNCFLRCCIHALAGALLLSAGCNSSSSKSSVTAPSGTQCVVQAQAEKTTFPASGGTGTLRIAANRECAWAANSQAGWVSLSAPAKGEGEGSLGFTVAANQDPSARSGRITVNEQEIQLSQDAKPCEFRLSSTEERFDAAGGERRIEITASSAQCEWTARADDPWINIVSATQGKGSGAVTFEVGTLSAGSRSGTVTIAGAQVRVEQTGGQKPPPPTPPQPGCTFVIGPVSFSFGASGGSGDVRVTAPAGCAWTAESPVPWITFTGDSSGSGAGAVSFRVAATDGPARTTLLKIANGVVTVAQSPGCDFAVTPAAQSAGAGGGAISIAVSTAGGCAWTATTGTGWLNIASGATGSGPGRVEVTVQPNTGPARSGTLLVAGRTVTITQASGCRYEISPSSLDVSPAGDSRTVTVATAAGCSWSAAGNVPWVTASTATGVGPGQVQLTVAANSTPARTGTAAVAGQPVSIRQPSLCTFMLNPESSSFDANGGQGLVLVFVTGVCTWTASSGAEWIRMDPEEGGTGSGFVRFAVAPNAGPARSGTVVIAGIAHRVTQAGR
jgi:hypothetical protein